MPEKNKNPTAFDTDVLIIGGGFGGLAAAIRIKELSPETSVLLVDKQTIGWGGKANKGAGVLWVVAPGDDINALVDFHVKNIGIYLNDQDLLYGMARKAGGGITGRIIPIGMTRNGSNGSSSKRCKDKWL
jgi:succinate dehydrogenase/fumarate reductase flavoprotein subunit